MCIRDSLCPIAFLISSIQVCRGSLFLLFQEGSIAIYLAMYPLSIRHTCPYHLNLLASIVSFILVHILSLISGYCTLSSNVSLQHLLQYPISVARNLLLMCSVIPSHLSPVCYNTFHYYLIHFDFCFGS